MHTVHCPLQELGLEAVEVRVESGVDEFGLVEWKNEHGTFRITPAMKVKILKQKIAKWVVTVRPSQYEFIYFFSISTLPVNMAGGPPRVRSKMYENPPWFARISRMPITSPAEIVELYKANGQTELAALEALDAELRKLDDYE